MHEVQHRSDPHHNPTEDIQLDEPPFYCLVYIPPAQKARQESYDLQRADEV